MFNRLNTRFYAQYDMAQQATCIYILTGKADCPEMIVTNVTLETKPRDECQGNYTPPAFVLDDQEAQVLMDTLWDAGVRPAESRDHSDTVRAMKAHLEDMRTLVFERNTNEPNCT
jgi:hypothetical protein